MMTMLCGFFAIFLAVLTCQESGVSAKLTLLESKPYRIFNDSARMARNLTCTSNDDLSALVWNEDLKYYNTRRRRHAFGDSSLEWSLINCYFDYRFCIFRWDLTDVWSYSDRWSNHMAPLMDIRWEGSFVHLCLEDRECQLDEYRGAELRRAYVRGTDLTLLGCTLYGAENKSSCAVIDVGKGIAVQTKSELGSEVECWNALVSRKPSESFLSGIEWRSLTFKCNESEGRVTVYDEVGEIMSCRFDDSVDLFMLRGSNGTLVIFRSDKYIYTTEANNQLLSPPFDMLGSNICIEMLMGLCAGCKASIQLMGEQQSITMGEVMSQSSSYADGSRPWQRVRFNTSVQDGFGSSVQFRMFTYLSKFDPHPLWAVSGIRLCKDDDTERASTIQSKQVWNEERREYVWPEVACQKLSNFDASLVRPTLSTQGEGKYGLTNNEESTNLNLVWLIAIPIVAALALLVYKKRNVTLAKSNDKTTSVTQDRANSIIRTSFHASPEDKTLMDQTHGMIPNMDTVQK